MVRAVLFIAIDFQESIVSMRFLENGIRYLQDDFEQLSPKLTTASVMEVLIDGVRKRYRYHNLHECKGKNELFSCYNAQMKMEDFPMGYIIILYQN